MTGAGSAAFAGAAPGATATAEAGTGVGSAAFAGAAASAEAGDDGRGVGRIVAPSSALGSDAVAPTASACAVSAGPPEATVGAGPSARRDCDGAVAGGAGGTDVGVTGGSGARELVRMAFGRPSPGSASDAADSTEADTTLPAKEASGAVSPTALFVSPARVTGADTGVLPASVALRGAAAATLPSPAAPVSTGTTGCADTTPRAGRCGTPASSATRPADCPTTSEAGLGEPTSGPFGDAAPMSTISESGATASAAAI